MESSLLLSFFRPLEPLATPASYHQAALGELLHHLVVSAPAGGAPWFATTVAAYDLLLDDNYLREPLARILAHLDPWQFSNLPEVGSQARALLHGAQLPAALALAITGTYQGLAPASAHPVLVTVHASILVDGQASLAFPLIEFRQVQGASMVLAACQASYVALFNDHTLRRCLRQGVPYQRVAPVVHIAPG